MRPSQARREQELRQLVLKGVPLRTFGKSGHWTVGSLHLYTAAGRWLNEKTGRRGRLNSDPMSRIVEREYFQQLCPEAAEASRKMEALYQNYESFMASAETQTQRYEEFMRQVRSQIPLNNSK